MALTAIFSCQLIQKMALNAILGERPESPARESGHYRRRGSSNGVQGHHRHAGGARYVQHRRRRHDMALPASPCTPWGDRKSVVKGKSVSVRVVLGGRLINKKKNT